MADKQSDAAPRAAAASAAAAPSQRLKLQTSYGQALSWAKGYAAPETAAAFARARDFAVSSDNPGERFVDPIMANGASSILRADLAPARQVTVRLC